MVLRPSTRLSYQDKPKVTWAHEFCCSVIKEDKVVGILEDYPVQLMYLDETNLPHALWFLRREAQESELKGSPVTGEQRGGPNHTLPLLCSLDAAFPIISSLVIYDLP